MGIGRGRGSSLSREQRNFKKNLPVKKIKKKEKIPTKNFKLLYRTLRNVFGNEEFILALMEAVEHTPTKQ